MRTRDDRYSPIWDYICMNLSTSEAADELGVSARQIRRAVASGRIMASRAGAAHVLSPRQVQARERTAHRGRDWSFATQQAALDLLSEGVTTVLTSTERSRLKRRIRDAEVGHLTGQILQGRVSLRRATSEQVKKDLKLSVELTKALGLSGGGGLGVLISEDATRAARVARLGLDDSGDIVAVDGDGKHHAVLEALALYMYGDARESSAAARWISARQETV